MAGVSLTASDRIVVDVAADGMSASVRASLVDTDPPLVEEDILAAVQKVQIVITDYVRERVSEFARISADENAISQPFVVAKGRPPFEGRDEELVWTETLTSQAGEWRGDALVNHYTMSSITTVEKDTVIGTIAEIDPPQDGVDVRGNPIKSTGSPQRIELDGSTRRSKEDSSQLISNRPGRVVQEGQRLRIEEVQVVPGDINIETNNLDVATHVHIMGTITDGCEVRSKASITVRGTIEAALVDAAGDIIVRGGIIGRNSSRVSAGSEIVAKFLSEADVTAAGGVRVGVQIINSRVRTEGKLIGERAAVIGGAIYARQGGRLASLGSDRAVRTRIFLGPSPAECREAETIAERLKSRREAVSHIRELLRPLLQDMKRLSATQREKATEMMFQADDAVIKIEDDEKRREQLLGLNDGASKPSILVSDIVHPGVTLSIGFRAVEFNTALVGPVLIEERKVKNVTETVAVNECDGSLRILASRKLSGGDLKLEYERLFSNDPSVQNDRGG